METVKCKFVRVDKQLITFDSEICKFLSLFFSFYVFCVRFAVGANKKNIHTFTHTHTKQIKKTKTKLNNGQSCHFSCRGS